MAGQEQPKQMTAESVLRLCVQQLGAVCVPMALYESVGGPIRNVMHNLEEVLRAMERTRQNPPEAAPEKVPEAGKHEAPEPELEEEEGDGAYIRQTGRIIPPRKN